MPLGSRLSVVTAHGLMSCLCFRTTFKSLWLGSGFPLVPQTIALSISRTLGGKF